MKTDWMRAALALVLVLSFQVAMAALFSFEVPKTNRDMLIYMLGQLSGMVTTALAYYFATTKSSEHKTQLLADAATDAAAIAADVPKPVEVINTADNPVPVQSDDGAVTTPR